jgi:membrane-associated phospholipid phosphatase
MNRIAAALALLTGMVAAGWAPLVGADVWTILAAHTAVHGRTGAVTALVAVTDLGSPVTVTVLTAVVSVVLLLRRHSRDAAYLVIVRVAALGGETALKHVLARPRPDLVPWLTTAEGFSFPSGHTTGTTALCVSLLVVVVPCLRRRGRAVAWWRPCWCRWQWPCRASCWACTIPPTSSAVCWPARSSRFCSPPCCPRISGSYIVDRSGRPAQPARRRRSRTTSSTSGISETTTTSAITGSR